VYKSCFLASKASQVLQEHQAFKFLHISHISNNIIVHHTLKAGGSSDFLLGLSVLISGE
jgi:hypothetical protein